jgi:hypothetical protein
MDPRIVFAIQFFIAGLLIISSLFYPKESELANHHEIEMDESHDE